MEPVQTLRLQPATSTVAKSAVLFAASVIVVIACALPVLTAERGRLTSDESLYASEALNIYLGRGLEYATGRPVTHRAPLFPALLAADFEVGGVSLDAASWVPRLATVLNAVLVLLIARRLAGAAAGLVAGVAAASSSYLNGFGASLFLDGVQTSFILASLLLLSLSPQRGRIWTDFEAGVMLGLATLTKESAILLLPLPLIVVLLGGATPAWRSRLAAWSAGFVATASWWWAWVYLKSGSIYLFGDPGSRTVHNLLILGLATLFLISVGLVRIGSRTAFLGGPTAKWLGFGLTALWGAAFIAGLEWQSWEHPRHYLSDVPAYFAGVVLPAVPAFPLVACALVWATFRTGRDRGAALTVAAAGLYLPFVVFFANRELSLRDGLPFLYIGLIALGCAAGWLLDWGGALARRQSQPLLGAAGAAVVAVAVAAVMAQGLGRVERAGPLALQDDWDNVVARDTASWIEANVEPGTPIMSTRLYYSQVYWLTNGRYPVHQLPTVLVDIHERSTPLVTARSTLFRWEEMPARDRAQWLYLAKYDLKGYYVGLAEEDVLADIRERGTPYLVLNAPDLAFSSLAFQDYFDSNPAFSRVYEHWYGALDATVIYRVDLEHLEPSGSPLHVTDGAYSGLLGRFAGDDAGLDRALASLNSDGVVVEP